MHIPKITVVVAIYNAELFIKRRLESILMQRGKFQMELCLFEDCSTDNTREVIKDTIAAYPANPNIEIKYFYNSENVGRQNNYNSFFEYLRQSKSDFACILDGDDWWTTPDFISAHLRYHRRHPRSVGSDGMSYLYYQSEDRYMIHPDQKIMYENRVKKLDSRVYSSGNPTPNLGAGCYKISAIKRMPCELTDFMWADWLFHFFLSWQGDLGFLYDILSVYRIHPAALYGGGEVKVSAARREKEYNNFLKVREFTEQRYPGVYTKGLDHFESVFYSDFH